jgi:hypothetical protein
MPQIGGSRIGPNLSGSGGSSSGSGLQVADFLFTEIGSGGGTYTATWHAPAKSTVVDMWLYPLKAPWSDATAAFTASDTLNGVGSYYQAIGLGLGGILTTVYDPSYITQSNFTLLDVNGNTYADASPWQPEITISGQQPGGGVYYAASDTVTMHVVTTAESHASGQLLVRLLYTLSNPTNAARM